MKEQAIALARGATDPGQALNLLREYLQAFVLRSLHESEAFRPLAFVGGTSLRFLHNLPRFSEDLDFSLISAEDYEGKAWMEKVKRDLTLAGFVPDVTWSDRKTVHTGWVRVAGVLRDAGLSPMADEKLAIKMGIDTRPPAGARCERRLVTRHLTFFLQHHDLPTLLAGKLYAAITRKYAKGRDWYDLLWYLSHRPPVAPNLDLLQHALDRSQGVGQMDARRWPTLARERLLALDMRAMADEVSPFLERKRDIQFVNTETLDQLLKDAERLEATDHHGEKNHEQAGPDNPQTIY
ncbi:MAG TPA: nucleotidyl transferase AbiEii/AbiGii toxin family protein [Kiritimatiellia bacterium]|nr:nucleotidyl transferase AbiEii/AbiGii toxin family protein [Kiritimatiellia bacterium]